MRTVIFLLFIICAENIFSQCPSAGVDFTVCGNIAQLNSDGVTGYWSGPPYAVFSPSANDPDASVGIPAFPESQRTEVFTWNETGCTPPESVTVTFLKPPSFDGGVTQSVCGMATQLSADTIGSGATSAYWTSYIPGVYINYTGPDPLPWNPVVDVSLVAPGYWVNDQLDVWFYWVVTNSAGCTGEDSVKVIFYRIPEAYAGSDTAVCGTSFTLQASWSISNHTGFWSLMPPNPGSANFSPNNDPNALATVAQLGIYYFIWTEMNASNTICSDKDTVGVNFMYVPSPTVGPDFSVCGKFAHIQAYTSYPYGQWSCLQGGVAYYDGINGNYNSAYQDSASSYIRYPSENVTITMCWTEFNGICYGYDCVDIAFLGTSPAIELVGAGDTIVCGPVFTLLNAQPPSFGSGYWIDTIFGTVFTPSATNPGPTTAIIDTSNGGSYGYHSFYWITTNQMCRDTSDEVKVLFIKHPEANAGGNYWPGLFGQDSQIKTDTVCGLSYGLEAVLSAGTGIWYTNDPSDVIIDVVNDSLHLTCAGCYTVFNTAGNTYREFYWIENNQGCIDSDTLRLYFAPVPTGDFSVTSPGCPNSNDDCWMFIASTWDLPDNENYGIEHFNWSLPDAQLCSSSDSDNDTIFVWWDSGMNHNINVTTINIWGCASNAPDTVLWEPPSGFISGQLTSSPQIDYSAFEIWVYKSEQSGEAQFVSASVVNTSGMYGASTYEPGDYFFKARLSQPNSGIPFTNTYYNNVWKWADAQMVTLVCSDSVSLNHNLYAIVQASGGAGEIQGKVRYDGTLSPVVNADVFLQYKPSEEPALLVKTDSLGMYSMTGIPFGNYRMTCEIPGLPQITTHHLVITPANYIYYDVNFIVDTSYISKDYGFGIYIDTTGYMSAQALNTSITDYMVYPVPFNDILNISGFQPENENVTIEIIDELGKLILYKRNIWLNQDKIIKVQTLELPSGNYFVKISAGEKTFIKKVNKAD